MAKTAEPVEDTLRLDKWLFFARFFKSRGLAAERIEGGGIRVNGQPCRKPGRSVRAGDHLTISARGQVRALEILSLGTRRGPAPEAQALYRDLTVTAEG
ncbi:RNA-binding S4 domain-containing protein [Paracoccus sp. TK19116]|uniref:RNA-binding S4 domain-containing protein n=1 Tax=Paracoccus albicereus TaxID=2922394 RepID=A0ABT1MU44_9RHOB|nr:RNA-binding S4 domain-containing protein [Paracoccus albicereus]MCQ0971649.1 RNA-binding S4 domain-containing protein [Paracoccus albicereus]